MKWALSVGLALALSSGFMLGRTSASSPTYARVVQTVTLKNYVCSANKPTLVLYEERWCLLSSVPLTHRPVTMDYMWERFPSGVWWTSASSVPPIYNLDNQDMRNIIHLAWTGTHLVLFAGFAGGQGPSPGPATIPDATIQYEAAY